MESNFLVTSVLLSVAALIAALVVHLMVRRKLTTRLRKLEQRLAVEKVAHRRAEIRHTLQRDMAVAMETDATLNETLHRLLEALVQIHHVDSGGVYLLRKEDGGFELVASLGLSPSFVESCSDIEADSERAQVVRNGRTQFFKYNANFDPVNTPEAAVEGLRGVMVVPLIMEGKVIGALNIGAHHPDRFQPDTIAAIESAAELVVGLVSRFRVKEEARDSVRNGDRIVDFLPIAILLLDDRLTIVRANAAATRLVGAGAQPLLQQKPGNAFRCVHRGESPQGCGFGPHCPVCDLRKSLESALAVGTSIRGEACSLDVEGREEGRPLVVRLNAEPLLIGERQHVLMTLEEIPGKRSGSGLTEGA